MRVNLPSKRTELKQNQNASARFNASLAITAFDRFHQFRSRTTQFGTCGLGEEGLDNTDSAFVFPFWKATRIAQRKKL
jgi:hypothetical protein